MISELEKIQRGIADALAASSMFAECGIYLRGATAPEEERKDASAIEVAAPVPLKTAKKAQSVVFEEAEVQIEVRACRYGGERGGSILSIAENVCRRIHNLRVSPGKNGGRILLAENRPFEFSESGQEKTITIKFNIQGVFL